ncbi:hypothetical protein BLA29_005396, partial [Euroglyphus maynei]
MTNKDLVDDKELCHCTGILMRQCVFDICDNNETKILNLYICREPYDYINNLKCSPIQGDEQWAKQLSPEFCMNDNTNDNGGGLPAWAMIIIALILIIAIIGASYFIFHILNDSSGGGGGGADDDGGQQQSQQQQQVIT